MLFQLNHSTQYISTIKHNNAQLTYTIKYIYLITEELIINFTEKKGHLRSRQEHGAKLD